MPMSYYPPASSGGGGVGPESSAVIVTSGDYVADDDADARILIHNEMSIALRYYYLPAASAENAGHVRGILNLGTALKYFYDPDTDTYPGTAVAQGQYGSVISNGTAWVLDESGAVPASLNLVVGM